jgi:hypothetical protein
MGRVEKKRCWIELKVEVASVEIASVEVVLN